MKTKDRIPELLSFATIKAANEGDAAAVNEVMHHYEKYILKLSTRKMRDEFGNVSYCVDEVLKSRLETKLLETIFEFKMIR